MEKRWIVAGVIAVLLSACATSTRHGGPDTTSRTPEGIRYTMDGAKHQFYKIYRDRLKEKPDLTGRVDMRFTIAANGGVLQTEVVQSTLNDRELESKISALIASLNFGAVHGPENTTFTFLIQFLPTAH